MAKYCKVTSGYRPDGSSADKVIFDYSEEAESLYSISFLDSYELYNIKKNNNENTSRNYTYSNGCREVQETIREVNTWDTLKMIPSSQPLVLHSQVTPQYTDLAAWDGSIDETEALGKAFHQTISGSWEFMLDHCYLEKYGTFYNWYTDLLESLHGQKKLILLNKDPDFFYLGRVFVESIDDPADGGFATVSIQYNINPYVCKCAYGGLSNYYKYGTIITEQEFN